MCNQLKKAVVDFLKKEDGPTAVEYAVMLALIIMVCVGTITLVGQKANSIFNDEVLKKGLGG
jgi:pilus assembly protein Flp/PilA